MSIIFVSRLIIFLSIGIECFGGMDMEENILQCLEDFDRLWQRVTAVSSAPPPTAGTDENQRLQSFLAAELCSAAYYTNLAKMFQGQGRQLLLSHAAEEKAHARRLRAEYFIRTGQSALPGGNCESVSGKLASLRSIYFRELEAAAAYREAAEGCTNEDLASLYHSFAQDEERHAQENRELLLDCF